MNHNLEGSNLIINAMKLESGSGACWQGECLLQEIICIEIVSDMVTKAVAKLASYVLD